MSNITNTHSPMCKKPDFSELTMMQIWEDAKARVHERMEKAADRQQEHAEKAADRQQLAQLIATIASGYFASKSIKKKKRKRRKERRGNSSSRGSSGGSDLDVGSSS